MSASGSALVSDSGSGLHIGHFGWRVEYEVNVNAGLLELIELNLRVRWLGHKRQSVRAFVGEHLIKFSIALLKGSNDIGSYPYAPRSPGVIEREITPRWMRMRFHGLPSRLPLDRLRVCSP